MTWTQVDDLIGTLRKRWTSGRYLRAYASRLEWIPISVAVTAPKPSELLDRFDEVNRWLSRFERDRRTPAGRERFAVEYRVLRSRSVGDNKVPASIRIDTFDELCALLGTTAEVRTLDAIIDLTEARLPALMPWIVEHPLQAIANSGIWPELLAAASWIADHDTPHLYLRHIDVEHVDTKFVETNRDLLSDLLTVMLPAERYDPSTPRSDFAGRYRFKRKPGYTRFRLFSKLEGVPAGITEMALRTEELASLDPSAQTIFVVENEISYLAFPEVSGSIVVFGSGFSASTLGQLPWLVNKQIVYWGDIDTHGFVILNRLRTQFAQVSSMLMDHQTLLAHPRQWVEEPTPTKQPLPNLTDAEAHLYRDLIEDRYGFKVRLEQERIRFSKVRAALVDFCADKPTGPQERVNDRVSPSGAPKA